MPNYLAVIFTATFLVSAWPAYGYVGGGLGWVIFYLIFGLLFHVIVVAVESLIITAYINKIREYKKDEDVLYGNIFKPTITATLLDKIVQLAVYAGLYKKPFFAEYPNNLMLFFILIGIAYGFQFFYLRAYHPKIESPLLHKALVLAFIPSTIVTGLIFLEYN